MGVQGVLAASTRSSRLPGGASSMAAPFVDVFTHSRLSAGTEVRGGLLVNISEDAGYRVRAKGS